VSSETPIAPGQAEDGLSRCGWVSSDPLYQRYHDEEWGRPEYDPLKLYELLVLESFQAGLSWITILRKRDDFRRAFSGFDPEQVAAFGETDVQRLLTDAGIVRHRGKIEAAIAGARAWLAVQERHPGGFSAFVWETVDGKPVINSWDRLTDVPVSTAEAEWLSKRLRRHGFRFVGPTTTYSLMQAAGLVDDHLRSCFVRQARA